MCGCIRFAWEGENCLIGMHDCYKFFFFLLMVFRSCIGRSYKLTAEFVLHDIRIAVNTNLKLCLLTVKSVSLVIMDDGFLIVFYTNLVSVRQSDNKGAP